MHNLKFPALVLFILITLLFLHVYGMENHLYLKYWFYDLLTHFLGGVSIAVSAFYILKRTKHIIAIAIIAGVIWEIFEVYYDITGWPIESTRYILDTFIDIVMDTLGAVVAWFFVKEKNNIEEKI